MKGIIEDTEPIDYSSADFNLGYLQEIISKLENDFPKDKRKLEYKRYVEQFNGVLTIYNKKAGEKIYKIIK